MKRIFFITIISIGLFLLSSWLPYYLTYSRFQHVTDPDIAPSEQLGIGNFPAVTIGLPAYLRAQPKTPIAKYGKTYVSDGRRIPVWTWSGIGLLINIFWVVGLSTILVVLTNRKPSVQL